jgi:transcriptional regulator with XRE-family HTH domain
MVQSVGGRTHKLGLPVRLRVAREEALLSQGELASLTDISRQSISKYETGKTTPKRPQIIAIAMATGFSADWLVTGIDDLGGVGGGEVRRKEVEPDAVANVARLEQELRVARDQAQRLGLMIKNLRSLAELILAEGDSMCESAVVERTIAGPGEMAEPEPSQIKPRRTSATRIVTEVVNTAGRPMHRDEVFRVIESRGLTEGMRNPFINVSIGLTRAVSQGRLVHLGQKRYAPRGFPIEPANTASPARDRLTSVGGDDA